ncbi:MAG: hypothetical protein EU547_05875 [Promethearchaeota archaeon]|nr:MAG: hypothetical protein EU547_05875 [Candidatus Lokiarchaeota archaeon]
MSINKGKGQRSAILSFVFISLLIIAGFFTFYSALMFKNQNIDILDNPSPILQSSSGNEYSSSHSGDGVSLNTTLHQSKVEQGNPLYTITNASDSGNNTFSTVCPDDRKFNNTYQEIKIENIKTLNKSVDYEDDYGNLVEDYVNLNNMKHATSFNMGESGYLENISIYLSNDEDETNSNLTIQIYNTTWNSTGSFYKPDVNLGTLASEISINNYTGWYTFSNLNFFLNSSKTLDKTFSVVLYDTVDDTSWYYIKDGIVGELGEYDSLEKNIGGYWYEFETDDSPSKTVDFTLKCDFSPLITIPNATDIDLKINNKEVLNFSEGEGIWNNSESFFILPEKFNFTLTTTRWWDYSCDITNILVNYTRTDLRTITSYDIFYTNQTVQWNATFNDFNGFNDNFSNCWINFTVPGNWENLSTTTENTIEGPLKKGYREFQIFPENDWYITAESNNLLDKILIFQANDNSLTYNVNSTIIIDLNTTFTEEIGTGNLSINIYSPSYAGNYLNHTSFLNIASLVKKSQFFMGNWTIANNATDYGIFKIQTHWNNGTDAGFIETDLTITGDTDLKIQSPSEGITYNSDQTFNVSVYYNDTARNIGIAQGEVFIYVNNSPYEPISQFDFNNGTYEITLNASEGVFYDHSSERYGEITLLVELSKNYYHNSSNSIAINILGDTRADILYPSENSPFVSGDTFNITVEYIDDILDRGGISEADISYSLNGTGYKSENVDSIGEGKYNITIAVNDTDFGDLYSDYGYRTIKINLSKSSYEEQQISYTFHRQIQTKILPSNIKDLGSILRGQNVSYTFNYSDNRNQSIIGANYSIITNSYGFEDYLQDHQNGNYTLNLDSDNVEAGTVYDFKFNFSAVGNETQIITLTINVTITHTNINSVEFDKEIARNSGFNQSISFYFNDTTNNEPVTGLDSSNVDVYDNSTGSLWDRGDFNWSLVDKGLGNYTLNVSLKDLDAGWYTLRIEVSKLPNYETSKEYITFYLRGNYTQINMFTVQSPEGNILTSVDGNYSSFIGSDMYMEFDIVDIEKNNELIRNHPTTYLVQYINLEDPSQNGTLLTSFSFDANDDLYEGTIRISALPSTGRYHINFTVVAFNYENSTYQFNLTIQEKFTTKITLLNPLVEITAGESFQLTFNASFLNSSHWEPIKNTNIKIMVNVNGEFFHNYTISTGNNGIAGLQLTIPSSATSMNFTSSFFGSYKYQSYSHEMTLSVNSPSNPPSGIDILDLVPIFLIIGGVAGGAIGTFGIYRFVIVPKKRERKKKLEEIKTIFDDAINIEYILVIYKESGVAIFFKSLGSDNIDPDLVSGFISAVSSFGEKIELKENLSEMKYGDKTLLLSDGEYIRAAVVLNKKASEPLRKNLKQFVKEFEERNADVLPNWRSDLKQFEDANGLVDKIFNISIILPHIAEYKISDVKNLDNHISKNVLYEAENLLEEPGRDYFFIGKLLNEVRKETGKEIGEVFLGIRELREKGLLIPIELSEIEDEENFCKDENKKALRTTFENNK